MTPQIVQVVGWPEALDDALACAYLGQISRTQLMQLVRRYPDMLRPFNLQPGGENHWSKTQLDRYIQWREAVGREEKSARGA